jgi:hypothetical protein
VDFVKKDLDFISKDSITALEAIQRFQADFGMDIRKVLSPQDWGIAMVDGQAEVTVTASGMRYLAMFSTTPDASERVEKFIAELDEFWSTQGGAR